MLLGGLAAAAAAHSIASAPLQIEHLRSVNAPAAHSWQLLSAAKTEVREGIYGEYEVNVKEQEVDNADSTFKSKEATEKGKVGLQHIYSVCMHIYTLCICYASDRVQTV